MKNKKILILSILLILLLSGCGNNINYTNSKYDGPIRVVVNMELKSPAFLTGENIPIKYTCDGDNVNPELQFFGIPTKAKSLVLIVDDPDAPVGVWAHWLVWNIKPSINKIEENSLPDEAVEGVNDFNIVGWNGPCPPKGNKHKYNFKLYALDSSLKLDGLSRKTNLLKAMQNHILKQAILSGYYER